MISPAGAHIGKNLAHLINNHVLPIFSNPGTINDAANPVDWSRLKNVPAGFADGVDAESTGGSGPATDVTCTGCVTSSDLGTITVRTSSVAVGGGTGGNGDQNVDVTQRFCGAGELALSWAAFWDGDLNGPAEGGGDDAEVTINSVEFDIDVNGNQGYVAYGGNDSGVDHTLTLQVFCMAA